MESLGSFFSYFIVVIPIVGAVFILLGILGKLNTKWFSIQRLHFFQRFVLILFGCVLFISIVYLQKQENYITKKELGKNYITIKEYAKLEKKYSDLINSFDSLNNFINNKTTTNKNKLYLKTQLKNMIEKSNELLKKPNVEYPTLTDWQKECLQFLRMLTDTTYYTNFKKTFVDQARIDLFKTAIKDGREILNGVDKYYLK